MKEKKPVSTCGCYEIKSRFPLAELVVMKEKTGFHLRNLFLREKKRFPLAELVVPKEITGFHLRNLLL